MDDLVAFVTARLDEDEETARATSRPAWREWGIEPWYDGEFLNDGRTERADLWGASGAGLFTSQGALPTVMADHIARHDPARVLREVEAKRKLIAAVLRYETIIDGEWGDCHEEDEIAAGLCPEHQPDEMAALRWLAAVYDDHPEYRPEWKP